MVTTVPYVFYFGCATISQHPYFLPFNRFLVRKGARIFAQCAGFCMQDG